MTGRSFRRRFFAALISVSMFSISACGAGTPDASFNMAAGDDHSANAGAAADNLSTDSVNGDPNMTDGSTDSIYESSDMAVGAVSPENSNAGAMAGSTGAPDSGVKYSAVTSEMINFKSGDIYERWLPSTVLTITADGESVRTRGNGIGLSCDGTDIKITAGGTFVFKGTLNGTITVNVDSTEKVRLVLDGFTITASDGPAINIISGDKVTISLEPGTENTVTDSENRSDEALSAAIFSKSDLVFNGSGTLTVIGKFNDGIQSKDDLRIVDGTYIIQAADDGIVGRDRLEIKTGTYDITGGGDALKSTNTEHADRGFVYIADGTFSLKAGDEAIDAAASILIENGEFTVRTGDGSGNAVHEASEIGFGGQGRTGGTEFGRGYGQEGFSGGEIKPPVDFFGGKPDLQEEFSDMGPDMSGVDPNGISGNLPENLPEEISENLPENPPADPKENPPQNLPDNSTENIADSGTDSGLTVEGAMQAPRPADEHDDTDTAEKVAASKGILCEGVLEITGGTFVMDTQDDAIHGNGQVNISDGTFTIRAGDDAIHADDVLNISGGKIVIEESYEGLEAVYVNFSGGDVSVTASDDGVNASGGEYTNDSLQGRNTDGNENTEGRPNRPDPRGMGGFGGMFEETAGYLTISGGKLYVNAGGDGLDANTDIIQSGGEVVVEGPTDNANGTLDYGNSYMMSGGTLTAVGSAGMLQSISEDSKSCAVTVLFSGNIAAGTNLALKSTFGKELTAIRTTKIATSFQFAGDGLKKDGTYILYSGDEEVCRITLTGTVTTVDDNGTETTVSGMGMGGGHVRS